MLLLWMLLSVCVVVDGDVLVVVMIPVVHCVLVFIGVVVANGVVCCSLLICVCLFVCLNALVLSFSRLVVSR